MAKLRDTTLLLTLCLALAACASPTIELHDDAASAVASIVLPEQLEVVTVNGLEIDSTPGLLKKGDTTLEVSPGRYEVLAFYRELWDRVDQYDILRSDPALFVVDAAPGRTYRLGFEAPEDETAARALAADFSGWVEDVATGVRTPSQDSGLRFRQGLVSSPSFDGTLVPAAPSDGPRQTVAPLAVVASPQQPLPIPAPAPAAPSTAVQPAAAAPATDDWLALMKSWWAEASDDERREFLRWVGERR